MRRKEKEITDKSEIESIIGKSQVCRMGLSEDGRAYIVRCVLDTKITACIFILPKKAGKLKY